MLKKCISILKEVKTKKDISFLVLSLSMFFLPLSINLSTFTLVLALSLKIIQVLLKRQKLFATRALKHSAIIGIVFFVYIIINSLIQAGTKNTLLFFDSEYSKLALLFLVPILLRTKNDNQLVLFLFFTGIVTSVLYVFLTALIHQEIFDRIAFAKTIDIHHTYLSIFLLLMINYFLINLIVKSKQLSKAKTVLFCLIISISFATIYIVGSKVAMLILIMLFVVHLFPEFSKKKAPKYLAIFLAIFIAFSLFNKKINVSYEKALGFRLQIWEASLNIFEDHTLFGNLRLPEKDLLNYNHYLNGKYYFLDSDLNCHNQYLSILMKFGIVGFLIFSVLALNMFKKTNKKTSKYIFREFLGFAIIILTVFYIEDILSRHHGIVFFTFFYNYYLVAIENAAQ